MSMSSTLALCPYRLYFRKVAGKLALAPLVNPRPQRPPSATVFKAPTWDGTPACQTLKANGTYIQETHQITGTNGMNLHEFMSISWGWPPQGSAQREQAKMSISQTYPGRRLTVYFTLPYPRVQLLMYRPRGAGYSPPWKPGSPWVLPPPYPSNSSQLGNQVPTSLKGACIYV